MFEALGITGIYDLLYQYMVLGFIMGYFAFWMKSPEGQWMLQTRLFKKPAKILVTFIPGRSFTQEVVVPKTEEYQKKPSGLQKLFGALHLAEKPEPSPHTLLLGWFRSDAPIYRRMGSAAQYIFNRQGEAPAFDIDRVEYGYYTPTKESGENYEEAQAILKRNEELSEEYKKLVAEGKLDDAKRVQAEFAQNESQYAAIMYQASEKRSWWRITVLPTQVVTILLNNALSLVKSKEYQGFLGKLDMLLKDVKWQLMATLGLAGIAALAGIFTVMRSGGLNFFGGG